MTRFLADENFNNQIVRGVLRQNPDVDIVRVQDVELSGVDDTRSCFNTIVILLLPPASCLLPSLHDCLLT